MTSVLRIAIPSLMPDCLDYLPNGQKVQPGMRVKISLRGKDCIGIVISEEQDTEVPVKKLKPIIRVVDKKAVIPDSLLSLLRWVSWYYHYPLGGVLKVALPRLLRLDKSLPPDTIEVWRVCRGRVQDSELPKRAFKQRALLEWLGKLEGADKTLLDIEFKNWRTPLKSLEQKGWVERQQVKIKKHMTAPCSAPRHKLNADQQKVVKAMLAEFDNFSCTLLEGVTGSGKTEVYLELCEFVLKQKKQVLVLVPEIALTIQTVARFRERFGQSVQVFHSGLSDSERLRIWSFALDGTVRIVIGTRSASFLPFKQLGLIVVDEEHDSSYKQMESLRYHARDMSVKRAQLEGVPILLGSATPALETLHNALDNRYKHQRLMRRAGNAVMPNFHIIDVRGKWLDGGLSEPLIRMIDARIKKQEQVLLFINRRGFAPLIMCRQCGEALTCTHCDAYLVYHKHINKLVCHHCDARFAVPQQCPKCQSDRLEPIGVGTQQIEEKIQTLFPDARTVRIDTDVVRRKDALAQRLEQIHAKQVDIIVGTQILTKGHHLPGITLTCVVDMDQGLFSPDFRSTERLAQLITQVGGRSGRGDVVGDVVLQTHHPDHPLLRTLLRKGYSALSANLLHERQQVGLPPYCHLTLLRVKAQQPNLSIEFLHRVERHAKQLAQGVQVHVYPPIPAMMEKRAGYHHACMLFEASNASVLNRYVAKLTKKVKALPVQKDMRWHFDVDPLEID